MSASPMVPDARRYLTDGKHLYEIERSEVNFGLAGGDHVIVVDCLDDSIHSLTRAQIARCVSVLPERIADELA